MKTNHPITSFTRRLRGARAAVIAATAVLAFATAAPARSSHRPLPQAEPCVVTARFVYSSSIHEALR